VVPPEPSRRAALFQVLWFNYSWNSKRETFVLLRLREDVVRIQIKTEPYEYGHGKQHKARTVFHCREKGEQKYPKGDVISHPDKGEWVTAPLFNWNVVGRVFPKPREPHGCMAFDN
jgi:hypothetical protein